MFGFCLLCYCCGFLLVLFLYMILCMCCFAVAFFVWYGCVWFFCLGVVGLLLLCACSTTCVFVSAVWWYLICLFVGECSRVVCYVLVFCVCFCGWYCYCGVVLIVWCVCGCFFCLGCVGLFWYVFDPLHVFCVFLFLFAKWC